MHTNILHSNQTQGYLIHEDLGAIEADAAHNGQYSLHKPNVEHGLGELKVTKVAWALCHPPMYVWHLILRSTVPIQGSLSPPAFGFPFSIVSAYSICATDICICTTQRVFTIKLHDLNFVVQTLQMCRHFF